MSLPLGSRLGPYEIVARIGAGGMGEVYRARDTRLDRMVALKVLPQELSDDSELRERFEREARAISRLNHPHICTVHDIGEGRVELQGAGDSAASSVDPRSPTLHYLVMEVLEGETLGDRLARGPLPLAQILRYAREIASALDCAHRARIVHRDLKPGNVMLTATGAKLLDFGLAKWSAPQRWIFPLTEPDDSTRDRKPLTAEGAILGTIHYMAPEQLAGQEADPRTDIFAFGALVYEMATGRLAFDGSSGASIIAAILEREPQPMREIDPGLPRQLERIVRTCLAKDPDDRFQTAHDLALQLEWLAVEPDGEPAVTRRRRTPARWALVAGGIAALLAVAAMSVFGWLTRRNPPERDSVVAALPPPPGTAFRFAGDDSGAAVISPDGRFVAFVAADEQGPALWVRSLREAPAVKIRETEGAQFPFWSPDSRAIAFFANETLKRVDLDGGPAIELAEAPEGRGGAWSPDGTILFAPTYESGLMRVPASGGAVTPVTRLEPPHTTHRWPRFLPDGQRFLYLAASHDPSMRERSQVVLGDLRDPSLRRGILTAGSQAEPAADSLLYVRGDTLVAQRLDREGNPSGIPRRVTGNVFVDPTTWRAAFSVSGNGILIHHAGGESVGTQLAWFDRSGNRLGPVGERALIENVRISPDGRHAVADIGDSITNLWIYDLSTGLRRRLTYTAAADILPVWSAEGRWIAFSSNRNGVFDLYRKRADGTTADTLLLRSDERKVVSDWSRDGRYLVYNHREPSADIWLLPLEGESTPRPLVATPFDEYTAQFSPDGGWFAYTSHETGDREIFIAPFSAAGPKWQISTGGGRVPRWRGDGGELFYLTPDDRLVAVELDLRGPAPEISAPRTLFRANVRPIGLSYDATADGERFLINTLGDEGLTPLTLILDWEARLAGRE